MKRYIKSAEEESYSYSALSDHAKKMAEFCVYEDLFDEEKYNDFIEYCSQYLESKLPGSDDFAFDFDFDASMGAYFEYSCEASLKGLYSKIRSKLSDSCKSAIKSVLGKDDYEISLYIGASPKQYSSPDFLADILDETGKELDSKSYDEFTDCADEYTQKLADNLQKYGYKIAYPWKNKKELSQLCDEHGYKFNESGSLLNRSWM